LEKRERRKAGGVVGRCTRGTSNVGVGEILVKAKMLGFFGEKTKEQNKGVIGTENQEERGVGETEEPGQP